MVNRHHLILNGIQRRPILHIPPQHILPKIPRQHAKIVPRMIRRLERKDLIQLLQRPLLSLGKTEIRKPPTEEIPRGVEAESACGGKGLLEGGPGEGEDEVKAPGCGCGEGHPVFADVEGLGLFIS